MIKKLARFILFKIWGWKIEGAFPTQVPKYIAVGGPHTSNWDFILSILVRTVQGTDIKFIAKKPLFRWPLGFFMRKLGGYPVDRKKGTNFVDYVIDLFNSKEKFAIAITPEGTRRNVKKFKTGFFYIAKGANIPVVVVVFDAGNKVYRIHEPVFLADNVAEAVEQVAGHYRGVQGIDGEKSIEF